MPYNDRNYVAIRKEREHILKMGLSCFIVIYLIVCYLQTFSRLQDIDAQVLHDLQDLFVGFRFQRTDLTRHPIDDDAADLRCINNLHHHPTVTLDLIDRKPSRWVKHQHFSDQ